jgi:hypothetical protein
MDLQILVVSMHQSDFSLVDKMNMRTNVIIANQTSFDGVEEKKYDFGTVKMISSQTRGVGLNRNIALLASETDILLFAVLEDILNSKRNTRKTRAKNYIERKIFEKVGGKFKNEGIKQTILPEN